MATEFDVGDAFEAAAGHGHTLEYALTVAADACLIWGDIANNATDLLRRAASAVRRPRFTIDYLKGCEESARGHLKAGAPDRAVPYLEVALDLYKNSPRRRGVNGRSSPDRV
jgi:hypothetical protein